LRRVIGGKFVGLSPLSPDLPFAITFSLLDFILVKHFDPRLPLKPESVLVESPACTHAQRTLCCSVIFTCFVVDDTPAINAAAHYSSKTGVVINHVLFKSQTGLVDCMGHMWHPLARQPNVSASTLREDFGKSDRML
jgi:hypothetical protein